MKKTFKLKFIRTIFMKVVSVNNAIPSNEFDEQEAFFAESWAVISSIHSGGKGKFYKICD